MKEISARELARLIRPVEDHEPSFELESEPMEMEEEELSAWAEALENKMRMLDPREMRIRKQREKLLEAKARQATDLYPHVTITPTAGPPNPSGNTLRNDMPMQQEIVTTIKPSREGLARFKLCLRDGWYWADRKHTSKVESGIDEGTYYLWCNGKRVLVEATAREMDSFWGIAT